MGQRDLPVSIEQALADLARVDVEAQHARSQLADFEEQARQLRTYVDVARKYAEARSSQGADGLASTTAPTSDASNGKTFYRQVTDMAVDLIRAKGRPIQTRDLLAQMEQRGLKVNGQNPVANLSGYLCRDRKRLVNNRRLGWRLVEWGGDAPPNVPSQ